MLASVVAHAVLLASVPDPVPSPGGTAARRIDARLVARPSAPHVPANAPAVASVADRTAGAVIPPASDARQSVADGVRRRDGVRSVHSAPLPDVAARALAGQSTARRAAPRPPVRTSGGVSGNDGVPAAVTDMKSDAVSTEALRQYRVDLAVAARRFNAYPDVARARGWQGTAEVLLEADARSPQPRAMLWRSSGHTVLDAQAVDTLARAARATPLPAALKTRALRVVVAIRFDLDVER